MLPYTPLHHLLLAEVGPPARDDERQPLRRADRDRQRRGARAARRHRRRIPAARPRHLLALRRLRGPRRRRRSSSRFAARARLRAVSRSPLPFETDIDILAAGPEQKNTFTLLTGGHAFVSQHIGDLENAETLEHYERHARALRAPLPRRARARRLRPAPRVPLDEVGARARPAQGRRAAPPRAHRERDRRARHHRAGHRHRLRRHRLRRGRHASGAARSSSPTGRGYERVAHLRYVPMPGGAGGDQAARAHGARHAARARPARPPRRRTAALASRRGRGAHRSSR